MKSLLTTLFLFLIGAASLKAQIAFDSQAVYTVADALDRTEAVAIGDLNEDGLPDMVSTNWTDSVVSVLIAKPGGGYNPYVNYTIGAQPSDIAIADMNNDGHPDIVCTILIDNKVSVLL